MIPKIIFYFFALLTAFSALLILFARNVLHAAFLLITCFLGVAAVYVFAGADFVAITQILVYVGGILVLMIFGVMLTNKISGQAIVTRTYNRFWGSMIGITVFAMLFYGIFRANVSSLSWVAEAQAAGRVVRESTIQQIGIKLMSEYILPFELSAVVLLIALIGAAYIAQRQI